MAIDTGPIFGLEGLEKIEYLGDVNGRWRGPVSCFSYTFRREQRIQYADKRDVPHLLGLKGPEGETLFRRP